MTKFKEANKRMFENVFVCKNCKKKTRASQKRVKNNKVKCARCGSKEFRQKHKEIEG